jgi:mannose/fructose-specific phosphotransferase system component IIA
MLKSAEMILGKQERVSCIKVETSDGPEILDSKIDNAFQSAKGQDADLIVLTDILGGGITNLIIKRIQTMDFRLIAGINLPLLLELFTYRDEILLDEEMEVMINRARTNIVDVGKLIEKKKGELRRK